MIRSLHLTRDRSAWQCQCGVVVLAICAFPDKRCFEQSRPMHSRREFTPLRRAYGDRWGHRLVPKFGKNPRPVRLGRELAKPEFARKVWDGRPFPYIFTAFSIR